MGKSFSSKNYGGFQSSFEEFDTADYKGTATGRSSGKAYQACYHTHPTLIVGGGTLYGGSCINPIITDADIYVGLDSGMRVQQYLPWERETPVEQFLYSITDMSVPTSSKTFIALVDYLCNQLQKGKHIHAGCIGGHGRTGTLFSAMFKVINDDKDAIATVRKLYCKKAVESAEQVAFLNKHFGINKVEGVKEHTSTASKGWSTGYGGFSTKGITDTWPKAGASEIKKASPLFAKSDKTWKHVNSANKAVGVLF